MSCLQTSGHGVVALRVNAEILHLFSVFSCTRGSSIMREVGWVIFDEIHYMRDPERGVVWEESLVLLPDCVRFVFLSATTPNARQFAEWIAFLHAQPCHVVTSDTRPVPLRHYMYPIGGDGLYLVLNEVCSFPFRLAHLCIYSIALKFHESGITDRHLISQQSIEL